MAIPAASSLLALPTPYLVMWGTLGLLTLGLVVLMRTRWGRQRPTHRYVLLSVVGHLLLICLAATIRFLSAPAGEPASAPIRVRIALAPAAVATQPKPADNAQPPEPVVVETEVPKPEPENPEPTPKPNPEPTPESDPDKHSAPDLAHPETENRFVEAEPASEPNANQSLAPAEIDLAETTSTEPASTDPATPLPPPSPSIEAATPVQTAEPVDIEGTTPHFVPAESSEPSAAPPPINDITPQAIAPDWESGIPEPVGLAPKITAYSSRTVDERWRLAERDGGSRVTEDAVAAGLEWLAAAQSNDGRWDSARWSAGRERRVLGHDRQAAGVNADTGVTGLALLTLMGAGHTHTDAGPYAETTRRGLEFLLRSQATDGDLAGDATRFARTYCHSMATFALAEALAHTKDERLARAVRRSVQHLVDRQHPTTGGWRYQPGQPGDMSQMGWVIMALRSAELGGVYVPASTWGGIERFVDAARRGEQGGLACYRRDGPTSRTMTAEALYCRQILGANISERSGDEAVAALINAPPGAGRDNLYYWYYATLALHHHRGRSGYSDAAWRAWNEHLTQSLVASQVRDGANAGSWSPNSLWAGYGGRVYATAMATMCLEVYYRYDPQQLVRDPWIAARPSGRSLR